MTAHFGILGGRPKVSNRKKIAKMFMEGMLPKEIAEATGISSKAVYENLSKAKALGEIWATDEMKALWAKMKEMADANKSLAQTAAAVGLTEQQLIAQRFRASRFGVTMKNFKPQVERNRRVAHAMFNKGGSIGCLGEILEGLSVDVQDWLIAQSDRTLVPIITGIINDAYFEEMDAEDT